MRDIHSMRFLVNNQVTAKNKLRVVPAPKDGGSLGARKCPTSVKSRYFSVV